MTEKTKQENRKWKQAINQTMSDTPLVHGPSMYPEPALQTVKSTVDIDYLEALYAGR